MWIVWFYINPNNSKFKHNFNAREILPPTHLWELDDLSTAQTQFLVIVQDGVHVLDPHSVYWSVKHVPALVLVVSDNAETDQRRQDTIRPVTMVMVDMNDIFFLNYWSLIRSELNLLNL